VRENAAASLSHAEMELVRAEDSVLASPNASALHKLLLRFEAISSMRVVGGQKTELASLLRLEVAQQSYPAYNATNELLEKLMCSDGLDNRCGLLSTFRYMETIEWVARTIKYHSVILPKTILNIQSRCLYGPGRRGERVGFRSAAYQPPPNTSQHYRAPGPEDVSALIDDFCEFVNKDLLSPTAQAGLSHFQIESIKPFDGELDGLERAIAHLIFYRRGLLRSVVAPLALGPARNTEEHARLFLPYQVGQPFEDVRDFINSGAIFGLCAYYTEVAARSVRLFLKVVDSLEASWHCRLGKIEKGSTLERLLHILPGMPMVTTGTAMKLVGRSFSATNDALSRLHKADILQQTAPIMKNRTFVASEAIAAFQKIENEIIPRSPVARDTLFFA
jgi:hypothetical protein